MTSDDWLKVIAALGLGTVPVGWFKWWTERKAAKEKAALDLRAQNSKEHAEVEVSERKLLPEMMKLYTEELSTMRKELRACAADLQSTTARMEREAMRMLSFIVMLVETNNRMRNRLYLCDTVMHHHDKTWISHDFVEVKIPSFKDPENHP